MGTKPVFPLLLSMSLPVILSMLIQSLYNIVDSFWVAKLGTDALTAVSLAFPLQNIVLSVAVGTGIGISTQVSICLGRNDREEASRVASMGILLVVIHCMLFFVLGLVVTRPFLSLFTEDETILNGSCEYTKIVLCLSFGSLIQICLEKILQGAGKMLVTMFLMMSGCIINIILDPIMIFGLFGFPAMGIRGAACATVIGQISGMILYIVTFCFLDLGLTIHPRYAKLDAGLVKRIYGVSLPSCLMMSLPSVLTGLLNAILVKIGTVYVAILGLYFKLQTFVNMPANGVIQGMRPVIGYNYGAHQFKRSRQAICYSLILVSTISAAGTILSLFFPGPILEIFDAEPQLLQEGIVALRLIGPGFVLSSVAIVMCGVMESLGDGMGSLKISLLRQFIILIPLSFVLSRFMGAAGVWIAFPIAELVTLFYAVFCMRRLFRNRLNDAV